jgi:hypothetical protein
MVSCANGIQREYLEVNETDTIQGINKVAAFKKKGNLTFERLSDTKTHHFNVPNVMEFWEPKPPGTLWATPTLLRDCFTLSDTKAGHFYIDDLSISRLSFTGQTDRSCPELRDLHRTVALFCVLCFEARI